MVKPVLPGPVFSLSFFFFLLFSLYFFCLFFSVAFCFTFHLFPYVLGLALCWPSRPFIVFSFLSCLNGSVLFRL